MRRLRALSSLIILLAFEIVSLVALRRVAASWRVDWSAPLRWMEVTPSTDVVIALATRVGIVVAGWLALTTVLYLLACITRVPFLIRTTSVFTLPGIRRLVQGAAAASVAAGSLVPSAAFAQTATPPAVAPVVVTVAPTAAVIDAPAPAADLGTDMVLEDHTVLPGDNFWGVTEAILEVELGRPPTDEEVFPRWRQAIRASQPIPSGDEDLILPGQVIKVPQARAAVAPVLATPPPVAPVVPVAPPAAPSAVTVPSSVAPATTAPATTVATVATVAEDTTETSVLTEGVASLTAEQTAAKRAAAERGEVQEASSGVPITTFAGGGLLAAGVVLAVKRSRRRNNRVRGEGEVLVPSTPLVAQVEMEARFAADLAGVTFVDTALRALGGLVSADDPPAPVGFILSADQLEVVLAEPAVAPVPFRGRGTHWTIGRDGADDLVGAAEGRPMAMPGVVTLGRDADGREVVVNLEDPGLLSLVGPGATEIVQAAAIQLATAPWSPLVEVVLVGFAAPPAGEAVRAVDRLDEALMEELEANALQTAQLLVDADCGSALEARMRCEADDTWIPTIIVCAEAPSDYLGRRLVGLVTSSQAAGVSALVAGHVPDSPWEVAVTRDGITLEGFGTTVVVPQTATVDEATQIRELLGHAAQAPIPAPVAEVVDVPSGGLIVDLYGPVTVEGRRFERGKALEALVYLACHPKAQVDGDRLMEAMWPGADPKTTRNTLSTTLFHARQAVTEAHLPKLKGGERLYATQDVVTSVQLLDAALRAARVASPEATEELWRALSRVNGRPFDSPSRAGHGGGRSQTAFEWAHAENHVTDALRVAVDAALRMVDLALDAGDVDRAAQAVRRGLLADPECERLRAAEMRVIGRQGDLVALEASMAAVNAAALADGDVPSAATEAVYLRVREDLVEAV